jgi:cytochrome c biogenesis factor
MPFGKGHLYFALAFTIVFFGAMLWSYLRDRKMHKTHYNGSLLVMVLVIVAVALLMWVKNLALQR